MIVIFLIATGYAGKQIGYERIITLLKEHQLLGMAVYIGYTVLSSWLEEQIKPEGMDDEQFGRKMANKDLREIASSDCFIIDLESPSTTMGKMVELGFAIANHKLIYVVAPSVQPYQRK